MSTLEALRAAGLPRDFAVSLETDRQVTVTVPNGYGLSVINDGYGKESGLLEFAVLEPGGSLTYNTPLTDDVEGWKTPSDVVAAAVRLAAMTENDVKATQALRELVEARRGLADSLKKVDALIAALGGAS